MIKEHFIYATVVGREALGYVVLLLGSQKPECRFIDQGGVKMLWLAQLSLTEQSIFR